jgi:hypothetical protein
MKNVFSHPQPSPPKLNVEFIFNFGQCISAYKSKMYCLFLLFHLHWQIWNLQQQFSSGFQQQPILIYVSLGEPILGWYYKEPPQGMVKEPKITKSFFGPFSLNFFTTINYHFSCLLISWFNMWLEVYLGISKIEKN